MKRVRQAASAEELQTRSKLGGEQSIGSDQMDGFAAAVSRSSSQFDQV